MKMAAQFHCETGSLRGALLPRERGCPLLLPKPEEEEEPARSWRGQGAAGLETPRVQRGVVGGSQGWAGFLCALPPARRAPACEGWSCWLSLWTELEGGR